MQPQEVSKMIARRLENRIRYALPIERSMPDEFSQQLDDVFQTSRPLTQPPFLEITLPYAPGKTLAELASQGIIHKTTKEIFAKFFGSESFKLHQHQEKAVAAVLGKTEDGKEKNLVVSTGTGSGKTECFLIPIVDYLVREYEKEYPGKVIGKKGNPSLSPGVRAMILYPMNALVNDQIRRLRTLLKDYPEFRFGKYTGELVTVDKEESLELNAVQQKEAMKFREQLENNAKQSPWSGSGFDDGITASNELTRRSQWQEPGHILITNYSMLEFLLLRPAAADLFGRGKWKFFVLDEAHCYSGALGTEISWLLRRLCHRVAHVDSTCKPKNFRFIATSATLGLDEERMKSDFASRLFPAAPGSFHIQTSLLAKAEPKTAGKVKPVEFYQNIRMAKVGDDFPHLSFDIDKATKITSEEWPTNANASLFELTQYLRSVEQSLGQLNDVHNLAEKKLKANAKVALADVLFIARSIVDAHDAGLVQLPAEKYQDLKERLFASNAEPELLQTLISFLEVNIGIISSDYNAYACNKWRKLLHDPMDVAKSSMPGEERQREGNRLGLLKSWSEFRDSTGTPTFLSLEAAEYLLRAGREAADRCDQDLAIEDLPVQLSTPAYQAVKLFNCELQKKPAELKIALAELNRRWTKKTGKTGEAEEQLAAILENDARLQNLIQTLQEAASQSGPGTRAETHNGRLDNCARIIFEDVTTILEEQEKALVQLVDLASLAKMKEQRHPLLEVRYHQLLRGISGLGISFLPKTDDNTDDAGSKTERKHFRLILHPDNVTSAKYAELPQPGSVFELGVCRNCGQPFVLGYMPTTNANNELLSRTQEKMTDVLHAFAWRKGECRDEDMIEENSDDPDTGNEQYYIDIINGTAHRGIPNGRSDDQTLMKCYWHRWASSGNPKFIDQCPCCGEKHRLVNATDYGVITPYEYLAGQAKVVAAEELARQVAPSLDPAARRQPGAGRKTLVFTDSRAGAARFAYLFQENHSDWNLSRLIEDSLLPEGLDYTSLIDYKEAVKQKQYQADATNYEKDDYEQAHAQQMLDTPGLIRKNVIEDIQKKRLSKRFPLNFVTEAICHFADKYNLSDLLALSNDQGQDLQEKSVAEYQLWRLLIRHGRNSLIRSGKLRVESQKIKDARTKDSPAWQAYLQACRNTQAFVLHNPDEAYNLALEIYEDFIIRGAVQDRAEAKYFDTPTEKALAWNLAISDIPENISVIDFDIGQANPRSPYANRNRGLTGRMYSRCKKLVPQNNSGYVAKLMDKYKGLTDNEARDILNALGNFLSTISQTIPKAVIPAPDAGNRRIMQVGLGNLILKPGVVREDESGAAREFFDKKLGIYARNLIPLRIEEHTAQLAKRHGAVYQRAFMTGRVNVLSCSTTFEMGVDVGDLGAVFLTNLPPSVSNYRQRAGRAGRRAGVTAYVLSFVQDNSHDAYYWEHSPELIFGEPIAPCIYLENTMIRARHLRAEALHDFLKWVNPILKQEGRDWKFIGDFFFGLSYSARPGKQKVAKPSEPIVAKLKAWHAKRSKAVQGYVSGIYGVKGNTEKPIGYDIADDLVFQLLKQAPAKAPTPIRPYPFDGKPETREKYLHLGGPNPKLYEAGFTTVGMQDDYSVQDRLVSLFNEGNPQSSLSFNADGYPVNPPPGAKVTNNQLYLLKRETLTWLVRMRILPKYGFPVDVINLIPAPNDSYAHNVDLARDRRLGLFEYAPGQTVMADKRGYESSQPKIYRARQGSAIKLAWVCSRCDNFFWKKDPNEAVPDCCNDKMLELPAIMPDAFQADEPSTRRPSNVQIQPGIAQQTYTGDPKKDSVVNVEQTKLKVADSENGCIYIINRGPDGKGYQCKDVGRDDVALYHELITDMAIWQLAGEKNDWPAFSGLDGFKNAMWSAAYAIQQAAERVLEVKEGEIGILPYPNDNDPTGFVLYDDVSGGAGHALSLRLTDAKDPNRDRKEENIRKILEVAKRICGGCNCAETRTSLGGDEKSHSCYRCLRNYRNRRYHGVLNRDHAFKVLDFLLPGTGNLRSAPAKSAATVSAAVPVGDSGLAHPAIVPLLSSLKAGKLPSPVLGFELEESGNVVGTAEAAWTDYHFVLINREMTEDINSFKKRNWTVILFDPTGSNDEAQENVFSLLKPAKQKTSMPKTAKPKTTKKKTSK
jgi:ATP-dependent helicase YprA (DUF1998 family)